MDRIKLVSQHPQTRSRVLLRSFFDKLQFGLVPTSHSDACRVPRIPRHCGATPVGPLRVCVRISFSIISRITLGCVLLLSSLFILDVSIVQYGVSVMVEGVRLLEEKDGRLLNWLFGHIRVIIAYESDVLADI